MTFLEAKEELKKLAGSRAWAITYEHASYREIPNCNVYIDKYGHHGAETFDKAITLLKGNILGITEAVDEVLSGTEVA